jgi:hypothetical protein
MLVICMIHEWDRFLATQTPDESANESALGLRAVTMTAPT